MAGVRHVRRGCRGPGRGRPRRLAYLKQGGPTMPVHLIYARAANGVIGKDNTIPWHIPEDMAHFKQLTQGGALITGRKAWDSLPPRFRPMMTARPCVNCLKCAMSSGM